MNIECEIDKEVA